MTKLREKIAMEDSVKELQMMLQQYLEANAAHTTLFGRSWDIVGNQDAPRQASEWIAGVVQDCIEWFDKQALKI
jgi:hypothetical protein